MSRYGDRFRDDTFEDLLYRFENSRMDIMAFVVMMLELLADVVKQVNSWKDED